MAGPTGRRLQRFGREHHTPLQVVATTRAVPRPLQLTGLDRFLDVVPAQRGVLPDAVG